MTLPATRSRVLNDGPVRSDGDFVLYWMIACRRPSYNFALQRACQLAREQNAPLLVLEALRHGYNWASDRLHAFILQGMKDNRRAFAELPARYMAFVETPDHPGRGLLKALSSRACAVVTDDFPCFFLPHMVDAAASKVEVAMEAVDSNGLLPMRRTDHLYKRAYDFRRYVHDAFLEDQICWPLRRPLENVDLPELKALPDEISDQWPEADEAWLNAEAEALKTLPIDHDISPAPDLCGGIEAAREKLERFLDGPIDDYHERRNKLTDNASSDLSPYLHFGHISPHRIFQRLREREDWSVDQIDEERRAKREGFWGMSPGAEAFLDQFVTWRELGFNRCCLDPDGYADYDRLPDWAKKTLAEHADDPRPHLYTLKEFEEARTHDELWNAAQRQLVITGRLHNYMRMLWGKKILHWSEHPRQALDIMIELNNKYALDGRDPNSYSGIFWVLGRFDRAWGPEREIFGKIRYMTSGSTRRKFKVDAYLERYGPESSPDA